jgi:hypothetical protein
MVPDGSGGYHVQAAALVKPNGVYGRAYMAGIRPFRYLIVYPQLMKQIARRWQSTPPGPAAEPCAGTKPSTVGTQWAGERFPLLPVCQAVGWLRLLTCN